MGGLLNEQARAAMAALWLRHRARMFERLDIIDAAVRAAATGMLNEEVRAGAAREAHRLAGSLGMFGLHEGTAPARLLEHAFGDDASADIAALTEAAAALRAVLEAAPSS